MQSFHIINLSKCKQKAEETENKNLYRFSRKSCKGFVSYLTGFRRKVVQVFSDAFQGRKKPFSVFCLQNARSPFSVFSFTM